MCGKTERGGGMINFAVQMNPVDFEAIFEYAFNIKRGPCRITALFFEDNVGSIYKYFPDYRAWLYTFEYVPPFSTRSYSGLSEHEREIEKHRFIQEVEEDLISCTDPKVQSLRHCIGWLPEDEFQKQLGSYLLKANPQFDLRTKRDDPWELVTRNGYRFNNLDAISRLDRGSNGEFKAVLKKARGGYEEDK